MERTLDDTEESWNRRADIRRRGWSEQVLGRIIAAGSLKAQSPILRLIIIARSHLPLSAQLGKPLTIYG